MQVFRAVLLLLGSVLTAAQTPTFGTQYTGDVRFHVAAPDYSYGLCGP